MALKLPTGLQIKLTRMPRRPRVHTAGCIYHVLNRAVRRSVLFQTGWDYQAFERVLAQGLQRIPVQLLAYSAMPTHWHLIVLPHGSDDLPRFMHWLTTT